MVQVIKKNTAEELWIAQTDHNTGPREANGIHVFFRKHPHPTDNPTIELVDKTGKLCSIKTPDGLKEAEYYFTGAPPPPNPTVDSNGFFGGTIGVFVRWALIHTAARYLLTDPVQRASIFAELGITP